MTQTVLVAGALSFIAAILGTTLTMALLVPVVAGAQGTGIRAEQVVVGSDDGTDRIRMRTGPSIRAEVQVLAADGTTPRVQMVTGGPIAAAGTVPAGAGFNVLAADGAFDIARMGTDGPNVLGVTLRLRDREGKDRAIMLVGEDGNPSINLLDADGNITWTAP